MTELAGPFGTMPHATRALTSWAGKGAKPDHVIQLNCGEVHTHAKYKTTRTWENFNNQGTKVTHFSNEL